MSEIRSFGFLHLLLANSRAISYFLKNVRGENMQNLFEENVQKTAPIKEEKPGKKMKKETKTIQPESFEKAMSELEELVRKLESGQLPLEESIATYKHARELALYCYTKLHEVQGELKKLGLDEDGNFKLNDLPPIE
jgi:exodeoxyribonuclease VII small subunit